MEIWDAHFIEDVGNTRVSTPSISLLHKNIDYLYIIRHLQMTLCRFALLMVAFWCHDCADTGLRGVIWV